MIIRDAPPTDPEVTELAVDVPADGRVHLPCSQAQQRFWFEEQLHPGNPGLNVAVRWRLEGDVADAELEEAWRRIVARHQPLRTSFGLVNGELAQTAERHVAFGMRIVDLTLLADADARAEAERLAEREARTPFDLAVAPLIRVTRLVLSKTESILLVTAHHVICDGWSVGILAAEMGAICAALRAGRTPDLPALPMSYTDYAAWERNWLSEAALAEESAYSKRLLHGYKHFALLPDRARPAIQSSNGSIVSTLLDRELTHKLERLGRDNGCTLFMTALAALLVLLHRHSGETDIMLGTQVAGRDEPELEALVGCFINTIALRTDLSGNLTFRDLLERVRDNVTESFEIRHFPLERLIEVINPKRDLSRNALFSVNFVVQRSFIKNENYGNFALIDMPSVSAGAIYDLNFFMVERADGWRASCEFNTDLFDRSTVGGLLGRFENVLRAIVNDPAQPISAIPVLSDAERHELVVERNRTQADYPADLTLPQLFAAQARRTPAATALVCGDERLSYAELADAVARMAARLRRDGLAPGTRIGVFLDRSTDLVVALLGVLEAGSAYVPLDPNYPGERISTIARSAGLSALIARSSLHGRWPDVDVPLVDVDDASTGEAPVSGDLRPPEPGDPAYVIYTSGSTGAPKGVQIPHRALVNFLWSMAKRPGLSARDTLVSVTTVSFDIAGLELYLPLIVGARLVLAQDDDVVDGTRLLGLLRASAATTMQATPTTWQLLIEAGWRGEPALKMLCGGEAIPRTLANQLLERGDDLWNMYGPTETTIWSSALRLKRGDGPVPLGPPIDNTQFYVLDGYGNLMPPGAPGELAIGGDGVATGYFGAPDLTAERFVPDPFRAVAGARLYKTGDCVRLRPNGQLEFLGRNDQQIKLRGFRIELGEIEAALARQPDIAEAAVIAGDDGAGDKMLVAFVVPRDPAAAAAQTWAEDLRGRVGTIVPRYMIPSLIVPLAALPQTPNGKVNRGALTIPKRATVTPAVDRAILTPTQLRLTEIIAQLLGREWLGLDDDIFGIGFHSLLAVRFVERVRQTFGVALPLRTLFTAPTVRGLAQQVDALDGGSRALAIDPIVTLNPGGSRIPFIFLHSDLFAEGIYSRRLATSLDREQTMHAVAPHGTAGLTLLPTIEAMAQDYLPRIRAVQPHGPYRIGGFCASGLVAYELAQLLRAEGEEIDDVLLINASALPQRAIAPLDALVRAIGLDVGLAPDLREALIYNIARLHAALATGPRPTIKFIAERMGLGQRPSSKVALRRSELETFEKRGGTVDTENSFGHLVASLTYHPMPYDGRVTLIWGMERKLQSADPTIGWGSVAREVRVVPMAVGHVTVLHEDVEQLGTVLEGLLGEQGS